MYLLSKHNGESRKKNGIPEKKRNPPKTSEIGYCTTFKVTHTKSNQNQLDTFDTNSELLSCVYNTVCWVTHFAQFQNLTTRRQRIMTENAFLYRSLHSYFE